MGKLRLKPNKVIIAEMMARGNGAGVQGIGSRDPGKEFVGRANRAVGYAIAQSFQDFKYPRADYPFAKSDADRHYRESFDVDTSPFGAHISNTAPSATTVEYGRGVVRAKGGGYLRLPLKPGAELRPARGGRIPGNKSFIAEYGGRRYLFTKKVRASDGYGIVEKAVILSYSR